MQGQIVSGAEIAGPSRPPRAQHVLDHAVALLVRAGGLTPAHRPILELVLLGRSHDDIARVLGKSKNTVGAQVKAMLKRLDADSARDLFRVYLRELDREPGGR